MAERVAQEAADQTLGTLDRPGNRLFLVGSPFRRSSSGVNLSLRSRSARHVPQKCAQSRRRWRRTMGRCRADAGWRRGHLMNPIYKSAAGERAIRARYLELLSRWPVAHEQIRVPTREGETFVVAFGPPSAPPLVLLQGSGANAAMWMHEAAVWSEYFRVYAVDVIGEPGLSAPSRPALSSGAYRLWLDDVMDELGVARAAVVGVSLGGWLALDYAGHNADRVVGLALLSPSGIGRQRASFAFKAVSLALLGAWGRRRTLELVAGPATPGDDGTLGEFALLVFQHFRPRLERVPVVQDAVLGRLAMPVLVVVGGRDVMLDSYDTRRRLERAAPHVSVRLLPEAGHVLPSQAAVVVDFLRTPSEAVPGHGS